MGAGDATAKFISDELAREYTRRDAVNTRSNSALASASGLVTVISVVIGALKGKDFKIVGIAEVSLIVAMIALLIAAIFAVLASLPWRTKSPALSQLTNFCAENWYDQSDEDETRYLQMRSNIHVLTSLRNGNRTKFALLMVNAIVQVVALISLTVGGSAALLI